MVELARSLDAGQVHGTTSRPTLIYRSLRALARAALGLFYRHIEVTGLEHLEPGVPTLLASTHPNSIVDPVLVGLFETRQVTFCARDGLFRAPLFGALLRAVGAVPIRRRGDHPGDVSNDDAFAACREVLVRGGVISIFPEGKTHARMRVEPIKTGTARMAIDAERNAGTGAPVGVRIVPVGLNYLVREAFRSDVHVAFGPGIRVAEVLAELERDDPSLGEDPRALVRALTERIGEAMRALSIHVEHEEDERLIAQVTAIIVDIRNAQGLDASGQSPAERTALVRRVIDAYHWLEQRDPIRCARLRTRVIHYLDERRSLGIGGIETALQKRRERRHGREDRAIFGPIGLVLGAPLGLIGVAVSIVPFVLVRLALLLGRPTTYRIALTKLLGGLALFGGWYGLLCWLIVQATGRLSIAVGIGAALIPLTVFAHRWVIDLRLHRFGLRKNLRRLAQRRRFLRLKIERRLLERELDALRETYLAERG